MAPKGKATVEVEPTEQQTEIQLDPVTLLRSLQKILARVSPADPSFDMTKASDLLTRSTTMEVATSLAKWASGSEEEGVGPACREGDHDLSFPLQAWRMQERSGL